MGAKPKPHATADLETDPFKKGRLPKAFAGGFWNGKNLEIYEGIQGSDKDCCRSLVKKCITFYGIIYLHNGGKFDLHFLLPYIFEHFSSDDLVLVCIGTRLVSIKTPTCEFRDSFALIPKALKSLSRAEKKTIAIWKLELSSEDLTKEQYDEFRRDVLANGGDNLSADPSPRKFYRKEINEYLGQDCKGLYDALDDFFNLYGRSLTLASAAFKTLKTEFGMPTVETPLKYDDKFRPFYFAGRVQFFELGKLVPSDGKTFSICDINSAFPAAMCKMHWFGQGYKTSVNPPSINREFAFYKIRCDSDGALPLRTKHNAVDFPLGNHEFQVTGWELCAALECKLIRNVEYLRVYTPEICRDFSNYVGHFYALKKNAKTVSERDFAKLFLNTAYGKFSLNAREFTEIKITKFREYSATHMETLGWSPSYDDEDRGLSFYQKPTYQEDGRDENGKEIKFVNVCTAASITGFVRAFLMRSMHVCGRVAYCDTDSILAEDVSRLKISAELGDWKLEKICDEVYIGGKKLYAARGLDGKWKTASKGVRLTAEQICKVALGEAQKFSFDAPNYSVYSAPHFTTRTVRRDDQRKKKK